MFYSHKMVSLSSMPVKSKIETENDGRKSSDTLRTETITTKLDYDYSRSTSPTISESSLDSNLQYEFKLDHACTIEKQEKEKKINNSIFMVPILILFASYFFYFDFHLNNGNVQDILTLTMFTQLEEQLRHLYKQRVILQRQIGYSPSEQTYMDINAKIITIEAQLLENQMQSFDPLYFIYVILILFIVGLKCRKCL